MCYKKIEDLELQENTDSAESFTRLTSTGGSITMTKFPDLWDGLGQLEIGQLKVKAVDDNDTVLHGFGDII